MADCQRMLDEDRRWFTEREGATLMLDGRCHERRAAVRGVFQPEGK